MSARFRRWRQPQVPVRGRLDAHGGGAHEIGVPDEALEQAQDHAHDVQEVEAEGGLPGMDQHNPPPQPKYLTVEERRNKESGYIRPIRTRRK